MRSAMLLLLLFVAPGGAAIAQTVYKCKASDGTTVYAQQPCGKDAEAREVKGQVAPSDVGDQAGAVAMRRNVAIRNADIAERNCITAAEGRAWRSANSRIQDQENRIAVLNYNIRRAANNLAGATWEAGMRQEIAGLQQSIANRTCHRGGDRRRGTAGVCRCTKAQG